MPMPANTIAKRPPSSSGREDRQLLAAHQRVHQVDGADAGLDEVRRRRARGRVQRHAVDAPALGAGEWWAAVEDAPDAVVDPPEQSRADGEQQRLAEEAHPRTLQRQPGGRLQHFDDDGLLVEHRDPAEAPATVLADHLDGVVEPDVEVAAQEQQRAVDPA
jgi:hypothetical protein